MKLDVDDDLLILLNKAYFFLKFRPRSKKEVENYLYKKIKKTHWSKDDVLKVIEKLEKQDLINDKKFIAWFVDQRNILKPKSRFLLTKELIQHGIAKNLIDEYFSKNQLNEEDLAIKTLKQRWLQFRNLNKQKRFEKSASFLLRRGFDFETVKKTIDKLEEN